MKKYEDKWALITGASAGIGATFARELAAQGANIIMTARRSEKLKALGDEIEKQYNVKTKQIVADLADPSAPEQIFAAITEDGLKVDILVNNAGYGLPGTFIENDWPTHYAFIQLMVTSYAHLAHLSLPNMKEKNWGQIINVASLAGLVPSSAGHTLYGASKSFLISMSQSLAAENAKFGVKVSALCPGFTYSEFHDVNGMRDLVSELPKYMFMDAKPVVTGAMDAVEKGQAVYIPGAWNKFIAGTMRLLPRGWSYKLVQKQSKGFRRQTDM